MKRMDMAGQPSLFEGEYQKDLWVVGNKEPLYTHVNHSVAAMRKCFIGWDGEGYTDEYGFHHYWLLANSLGDKLIAPPGRSLERYNINRMFHQTHSKLPNAIHVGFALGYDFTMLLRANGILLEQAKELRSKGYMTDQGYVYRLMMGKQLSTYLAGGNEYATSAKENTFNLQDTWGYFQRSFVKALDEYFPDGWPYRDIIMEMKAKRSTFDRMHDEDVIRYNDMELELLVMLMEELRDRLYAVGMPVSRWYGPGALAQGLMSQWKIKHAMEDYYETKPNLAFVFQQAYAGGRFELVKPGHVNGPVYQYDINSAYPAAIAELPNLKRGEWKHENKPDITGLTRFSVVRVRWTTDFDAGIASQLGASESTLYPQSIPFPLWRRTPDSRIHYPSKGIHGWYWLPEVLASIEYGKRLAPEFNFRYEIEESYSFIPMYNNTHIEGKIGNLDKSGIKDILDITGEASKSDILPFYRVPELYRLRQQLKAKGSGAHIGIKLGLNSLYGKFAQQIGYNEKQNRKPPFHNLAYAGFITASCRAKMIEAATLNPESIIAFETDGVFSTAPLDLPVSTALGDWEETKYDDMWYFQSGFRFGIKDGETVKPATRGIPLKDISLEHLQETITHCLSTLVLNQTQFITLNWAVAMNRLNSAGQWKTAPRVLHVMNEDLHGKRIHDPDCPVCVEDAFGVRHYNWNKVHLTVPASGYEDTMSYPHPIIWNDGEKQSDEETDDFDGVIEP